MIKIMKYREVYRLLPVLAAALMLTGLSVRGASAAEGDIEQWRDPWTRLGYTYDWGNPGDHVGLSELRIRIHPYGGSLWVEYGKAIFYGTPEWDDYFRCGPEAPRLISAVSKSTLTLAWTAVPGAAGYRLRYKWTAMGKPFVPPFEADGTLDLGNVREASFTLPPGACCHAAVQAYDVRGPGRLSNIEYIHVP